MRYSAENNYDAIVSEAASAWDVSAPLIKGIIAAESEFNPAAYRAEPQIGDASYGLMQLLYRTATALGYTGSAVGLADPTVNIRLGTRFLADLIKTARNNGYGIDAAISAYNAGFSAVRPGDGKRVTNAADSPFVNQSYVDKVIGLANYFAGTGAAHQLETVTINAAPATVDNVSMFALLAFAAPLLMLLLIPRHR